jgi:phage protein D
MPTGTVRIEMRKPTVEITYRGTNVTNDIYPFLKGITYNDKINHDSPDIDIEIDDSQRLWQSDWSPTAKDKIEVKFLYLNTDEILDAGVFEVDDLKYDFSDSGDRVSIGAQATPVAKNLREKRSKEYENVTLKAIVDEVAKRQSLTVKGTIVEVSFERITQNEESDLFFLQRIAKDYGQLFKVEGENLIFYNWSDLDAQESVFELTRADITSFSVTKKLVGTYKSALLTYSKPDDEAEIEVKIEAAIATDSEDVLVLNERAETQRQAELIATEKLRAANATQYEGEIAVEGEARYIAGLNFTLSGFGIFDGLWQIQESSHQFTPNGGWSTSLRVRGIGVGG